MSRHRAKMEPHANRLADGDTVPVDGYPVSWSARLLAAALTEPTQKLPTVRPSSAPPALVRPFVMPRWLRRRTAS